MDFLSSFIEGNDELKTRLATVSDFGQELDNENNAAAGVASWCLPMERSQHNVIRVGCKLHTD